MMTAIGIGLMLCTCTMQWIAMDSKEKLTFVGKICTYFQSQLQMFSSFSDIYFLTTYVNVFANEVQTYLYFKFCLHLEVGPHIPHQVNTLHFCLCYIVLPPTNLRSDLCSLYSVFVFPHILFVFSS